MIFITFLCLQFLLISAKVASESSESESSESEEISAEDFKILLCDEKNAEISKIIVGCFDESNLPEYSSIIAQCYAGSNVVIGEMNGQMMKDWYCAHNKDEITNADECSEEMVLEKKGEEFLNDAAEQFAECMEKKLPSDKRKK